MNYVNTIANPDKEGQCCQTKQCPRIFKKVSQPLARVKHRIAVYLDAINHIETALIVIFPFGADHSDFVPSFPQRLSQVPHPSVEWERTVLQQHKHSGGY
jgi:hypothetical protein